LDWVELPVEENGIYCFGGNPVGDGLESFPSRVGSLDPDIQPQGVTGVAGEQLTPRLVRELDDWTAGGYLHGRSSVGFQADAKGRARFPDLKVEWGNVGGMINSL